MWTLDGHRLATLTGCPWSWQPCVRACLIREKAGWWSFQHTVGTMTALTSPGAAWVKKSISNSWHARAFTHSQWTGHFPLLCRHSQFCSSLGNGRSVRKSTHQLILEFFESQSISLQGASLFFPISEILPNPEAQNTAQETQAAESEFVGSAFHSRRYNLSLSLFSPHLHIPNFPYKVVHNGLNAQKCKATCQPAPASAEKYAGLQPRANVPPFKACFQSLHRSKELRTGDHHTLPLCSQVPTARPHPQILFHAFLWADWPRMLRLHSYTGCPAYNGESLRSSQTNLKI